MLHFAAGVLGPKKDTLEQLHFYHLVHPQGVYNSCRMLCFYIKTFQTSYHFVFIFKHFVSVVLVVGVLSQRKSGKCKVQSQWNSLTRLTKLLVQLCCVGRQKCFVSLSGNQLKISDVLKILFSVSLLETPAKIFPSICSILRWRKPSEKMRCNNSFRRIYTT